MKMLRLPLTAESDIRSPLSNENTQPPPLEDQADQEDPKGNVGIPSYDSSICP